MKSGGMQIVQQAAIVARVGTARVSERLVRELATARIVERAQRAKGAGDQKSSGMSEA